MPRRTTPTVAEAVEQYLASRTNLATNTVINERSLLTTFVTWIGPDKKLVHLRPSEIERYFVREVGPRNPSAISFNKVRMRLMAFCNYCRRHGWVTGPDLFADVPKRKTETREKPRLEPRVLVEILEAVDDPRDRCLLALAGNTALRSGEITALTISSVDLDNAELYLVRFKTRTDDRMLITPMLQRELRRWLTTYTEELQAQGLALTDDMLLFPARTYGQFSYAAGDPTARYKHMVQTFHRGSLRPYDELRKPFRIAQRAFTAFGIEHQRGMGMHTFRRSCARAFFESLTEHGYDRALRSTMSLLGHKNSATTELYLGLSYDRKRRNEQLRTDFLPTGMADVIPLRRPK